ncbi:hypothetical protein QTP86_000872 [Hemibagrus guttatus]|nr:hypothetical protein QTP86_000872 [Hemibagrus guttatus]
MGRGSPIPPMLRRKIMEQYQKVSQRKIAKSLKLSSSTVHNIIQRFRESGTISVRKGQGRKTILNARDLRALRTHCITYRNATVMEITTWAQEYFQKTLSVNTIHRAIRRCRLKLYRSKKKPYLNMIQKRRRFLWAKAHLKWTVAKWKTVLWSDESKFEVLFGKLGRHVIRTKEDKDNPSYQRSVQKPASLMVWGCMSACGMGSLHIWKGTINAESSAAEDIRQTTCLGESRAGGFPFPFPQGGASFQLVEDVVSRWESCGGRCLMIRLPQRMSLRNGIAAEDAARHCVSGGTPFLFDSLGSVAYTTFWLGPPLHEVVFREGRRPASWVEDASCPPEQLSDVTGPLELSISCDALGVKSWSALDSALRSETSNLRELHLTVKAMNVSRNNLRDSGVKSLSAVLENPHCKLETLSLIFSDKGFAALTSALRSNPSHLRYLDLSFNNLGDSEVKSLSAVLENPHCKLEILELYKCGVSDEGCAALTSALRSNPSHLRHLDLSWIKLGDSVVKILSAVLENPDCKLETLELSVCDVSAEGCAALISALRSNPSHLRHLNLSYNKLGDSGVKSLSAVLENPHCKLETLRLHQCDVSDEGFAALTSALRSNPSHLRYLDLSNNNLGVSGVKSLSAVLENPHCKLEKLGLHQCGVSDEGCAALTSALRSNPSHLRDLNLTWNNLGDSGMKSLSAVLENPHCKLETLRLCKCGVSDEGCAALTSALRSNSSHLRYLDLSENKLGVSGVKSLSAVLENLHCKLETLELRKCGVSDKGCAALTSALRSNPSHLRELNLSCNNLGDSGKKLLSALKDDEHYKLQTLIRVAGAAV